MLTNPPKQFTVKTRSNYRGLNDTPIDLCEITGTRVTGEIHCNEANKKIKVDFKLSEVTKFI